ncbi:ArsR/SmtB family transcription factor [Kocuria rhizophila]|uniref:ArsR/SmtB family transcription factor n=1 Tax=Kocuria rhizophila TaxID=72000 RepID=UPI001D1B2C98|nr:metalloregulator ArsR/SmtB family transcription factor [Kocuria rhizophila]MCC5671554.1 metalloregulator ArsR/SmtB family transcription factor [Kocuria rhizophila]
MSHDAYSALSDPTRRRILAALRGGPRPVGELVTELEVSQPTVSKHLKVLRDAHMVSTRAQGQKRFYSIAPEPLTEVADWLDELVAAAEAAPQSAPVPETAATPSHDDAARSGDDPTAPSRDHANAPSPAEEDVTETTPPTGDVPETSPTVGADMPSRTAGTEGDAAVAAPAGQEAAPAVEPAGEDVAEPAELPAAEPERSVPWFTADITEVTGPAAVESDVEPDGAAVDGEDADATAEDAADESTPSARTGTSGEDVVAETAGLHADSADAVANVEHDPAEDVADAVADVERETATGGLDAAAARVEDDVPADSTAQPGAAHEEEPRGVEPRDLPEDTASPEPAEPMRPRGGAHRRQSGLLSTLTGFRRRGRGSRRD